MEERWRWIDGYEDRYLVSDLGRIKSVRSYYKGERILKPLTGGRYHQVRLYPAPQGCLAGNYETRAIHLLVAEAFIGPCPPGMECRHLDGDILNNAARNLAWGAHSENMLDKIKHGTDRQAAKVRCVNGHEFTPENTYESLNANGRARRTCRRCRADRTARWRQSHQRR